MPKLRRIKYLKEEYWKYLYSDNYDFLQHKPQIIELFKLADIKNFGASHVERVSFNDSIIHSLNGFDNIGLKREDIVHNILIKFEETIGIFKTRRRQSFNPIYWIEFIVRLPEQLFSFVSITPPNSIMKIIQLLYWIAGFLVALDKFQLIEIANWFN